MSNVIRLPARQRYGRSGRRARRSPVLRRWAAANVPLYRLSTGEEGIFGLVFEVRSAGRHKELTSAVRRP
jgi:hypothetical protein